jgi:hypothetical protein
VTFAATVAGGIGIPTGTVVLYDGTNPLGSATLDSSGTASLKTRALSAAASPHSITTVYGGDSNYSASTSAALSQVIINNGSGASSNGLCASWPFSEGFGTTVSDASGNGNTGTLVNSPLWVPGPPGHNALAFPGSAAPGASAPTAAYVTVPDSAALPDQAIGSPITICAWVKRSQASVGNFCSVVAKDVLEDTAPWHRNYELIFDKGSHILFVFRNSAGTAWEEYSSDAIFTDTNDWHFYCVTYTYGNASSCALYVDGAPVPGSWVSGNGSDAPASTSAGPVLIGMDGTGTASNGSLYDDISIYNVVLSASQVLSLYASLDNISATPPQITAGDGSLGFMTGQFGFGLQGSLGQTIVVDGSADLVNWTPLWTNTAGAGPFYFCDPASTNTPWRFYRARSQ